MKNFLKVFLVFTFLGSCDVLIQEELSILSGSENEALEPFFEDFFRESGIKVSMKYLGSVDIMMALRDKNLPYDAVWPANSLWITLGDTSKIIKHAQSIFTSPVIFGLRKAKAQELGWVGKDVLLADILQAIRSGRLRFLMTSATQSNSGASAYLGFLNALMGNPEVIQLEDLNRPQLVRSIKDFLRGIYRSSGSSGWLKDLFLKTPEADAMVNYESVLIETNQELITQGQEPLYLVYPLDSLVISDSPLGFNSQKSAEKEAAFLKFQNWLLKPENQNRLLALGRRTGLGGDISAADRKVFNPDWGIDPNRIISPVRLPSAEVIERSLILYQTAFRKPSFTVFVLDYSGSMRGTGEEALKESMMALIDQDQAEKFLIQAGDDDQWVLIAFSDRIKSEISATGNSARELEKLMTFVNETEVGGATDIFSPLVRALNILRTVPNLNDYLPSIILMTDGEHNTGPNYDFFVKTYRKFELNVPVFSILYGEASREQIEPIANLTRGRVFDGRIDLVKAFRTVRGYN